MITEYSLDSRTMSFCKQCNGTHARPVGIRCNLPAHEAAASSTTIATAAEPTTQMDQIVQALSSIQKNQEHMLQRVTVLEKTVGDTQAEASATVPMTETATLQEMRQPPEVQRMMDQRLHELRTAAVPNNPGNNFNVPSSYKIVKSGRERVGGDVICLCQTPLMLGPICILALITIATVQLAFVSFLFLTFNQATSRFIYY